MAKRPAVQVTKATAAEIRRLGAEQIEIGDATMTRDEHLAQYLWKLALPRTESVLDIKTGNKVLKSFDPEKWAIELLMERKEGRAPNAIADEHSGPRVSDRVRALATSRLNALTEKIVKGPPQFTPKETPSDELIG